MAYEELPLINTPARCPTHSFNPRDPYNYRGCGLDSPYPKSTDRIYLLLHKEDSLLSTRTRSTALYPPQQQQQHHQAGHETAESCIRTGGAMTADTTYDALSFCSSSSLLLSITPIPERHRNGPSITLCDTPRTSKHGAAWKRSSHSSERSGFVRSLTLSIFCCLLFLCQVTTAAHVYGEAEVIPRQLLFDRRPPPPLPRMGLEKRRDHSSSVLPSTTTTTTAATHSNTDQRDDSLSGTSTSSGLQMATDTSTALPKPFDTNLGNNFTTTSCPKFFTSFLSNQTFIDCLPFSLLLQVSPISIPYL